MWLAASARARARCPGGLMASCQRAAAVFRGCGERLLSTDASSKTEVASASQPKWSISASMFADAVRKCGLTKNKLHKHFYPEERGLCARSGQFPIAVAVSGGADSMALMLLLREYLQVNLIKTPLLAITVDHQLRAESTDEASEVARVCAVRWGITHITRRCEWRVEDEDKQQKGRGNDDSCGASRPVKPGDSKMEEQSRRYRYELLQQVCRENRVRCLFVAHNLGDQLETTLFRLGRASGINGLAGMASQLPFFSRGGAAGSANGDFDTETQDTVRLVRPLLSFTKDQLMATCGRFQQSWAHDPSNDDPVYDRVRIRQELKRLENEQGSDVLELFSKFQQAAAKAKVEFARAERHMFRRHVVRWKSESVIVRMSVFSDPEMFDELLTRILSEIITSVGSKENPPRLASITRLARELQLLDTGKQLTLGGCRIKRIAKGHQLQFQPEHGHRQGR